MPSDFAPLFTADHLPSFTPTDSESGKCDTEAMTEITRYELDAKLQTIETKMDARVASIEGKIDAFLAIQAGRDAAQDVRNKGFDASIDRIEASMAASSKEIKTGIGSMKTTMVVTAISAVLAIVFGIVTFNAAMSSSMLGAFQAGKDSSQQIQPAALEPSANTQAPKAPPAEPEQTVPPKK